MADTIWVYAEISDDRITTTSLEMLAKAAEVGKAEAILLGPAPDDAVQTLAKHGASKIYRCADAVYRGLFDFAGGRDGRRLDSKA